MPTADGLRARRNLQRIHQLQQLLSAGENSQQISLLFLIQHSGCLREQQLGEANDAVDS